MYVVLSAAFRLVYTVLYMPCLGCALRSASPIPLTTVFQWTGADDMLVVDESRCDSRLLTVLLLTCCAFSVIDPSIAQVKVPVMSCLLGLQRGHNPTATTVLSSTLTRPH